MVLAGLAAKQQRLCIYNDTGAGISSEQAKFLFDETQITGTRHRRGLHIIWDLTKAISCSIKSMPDYKLGTTFVLAL